MKTNLKNFNKKMYIQCLSVRYNYAISIKLFSYIKLFKIRPRNHIKNVTSSLVQYPGPLRHLASYFPNPFPLRWRSHLWTLPSETSNNRSNFSNSVYWVIHKVRPHKGVPKADACGQGGKGVKCKCVRPQNLKKCQIEDNLLKNDQ